MSTHQKIHVKLIHLYTTTYDVWLNREKMIIESLTKIMVYNMDGISHDVCAKTEHILLPNCQKIQINHTLIIGRFLSWLGSRIFTFGNVSRDTSLIIGQSELIFFHYI